MEVTHLKAANIIDTVAVSGFRCSRSIAFGVDARCSFLAVGAPITVDCIAIGPVGIR